MAFFEELGKTLSDKGKEAAKKAKDLTEALQLKSQLSAEKEKVNQAYITLGRAYYDSHDASAEETYAAEFEVIRTGLMKMAELEDEICELEGSRICVECGAKIEKGAMFCSRCGAKMPPKPETVEVVSEDVPPEAVELKETEADKEAAPQPETKPSEEY